MLLTENKKSERIYKDIVGNELSHGDKVVTIEMNGKARGGNLVFAYVDLSTGFQLKFDMNNTYRSYRLYKISPETKVLKVTNEHPEVSV